MSSSKHENMGTHSRDNGKPQYVHADRSISRKNAPKHLKKRKRSLNNFLNYAPTLHALRHMGIIVGSFFKLFERTGGTPRKTDNFVLDKEEPKNWKYFVLFISV